MTTKFCSKCRTKKSLDEFHADKNRPDGRRSQCKNCRSRQRVGVTLSIESEIADHEHICMICEYQTCKNSADCRDRLRHIVEQQYQKKVTQPLTQFPVYCDKLGISDNSVLSDHVYRKFLHFIQGAVPSSEISVEIVSGSDNARQKAVIHVPLELKFSELRANEFRNHLRSHLIDTNIETYNSLQIPFVEGCENVRITCCEEYLTKKFPHLLCDHITYSYINNKENVLVSWPKNFSMTSNEVEAATSIIYDKIIEKL